MLLSLKIRYILYNLKKAFSILIILLAYGIIANQAHGQKSNSFKIDLIDKASEEVFGKLKYPGKVRDEKAARKEMLEIREKLFNEGYLTASFDTIISDSAGYRTRLYIGKPYYWAKLLTNLSDRTLLGQIGFKERYFNGTPLTGKDISALLKSIVRYYEQNGYPFASASLDSVTFSGDSLIAGLDVEKNMLIRMDTIQVKGSSKIKSSYLHNYLDIKPGHLYDESKIEKIGKKLDELPFASEIRPFEIGFTEEKAMPVLYLEKKQASQFDGIIGVAPSSTKTGKLLVTGDVKLKLVSILNRGEVLDFNWRSLEAQTQDLRIKVTYPFLFSTPFGLDYRFWLLKQDTSFITLNNNIGLQYHFETGHYLKVYFEAINSSLLSTAGLEETTELPEYADIRNSNYGLEYQLTRLDYLWNPMRGVNLNAFGSFGSKKINENPSLNPEIYDSLDLSVNVFKAGGKIDLYIPLFRGSTFLVSGSGGYIESDNLFTNELFRIGGLKTLRGFDEESIFASSYTIINAEFRYLFEKDSYFSLFWNGGWYEKMLNNEFVTDTPWGFGAGVSFRTQAGVFSVFYALGKQFDNPLELRGAKLHFGYTSIF